RERRGARRRRRGGACHAARRQRAPQARHGHVAGWRARRRLAARLRARGRAAPRRRRPRARHLVAPRRCRGARVERPGRAARLLRPGPCAGRAGRPRPRDRARRQLGRRAARAAQPVRPAAHRHRAVRRRAGAGRHARAAPRHDGARPGAPHQACARRHGCRVRARLRDGQGDHPRPGPARVRRRRAPPGGRCRRVPDQRRAPPRRRPGRHGPGGPRRRRPACARGRRRRHVRSRRPRRADRARLGAVGRHQHQRHPHGDRSPRASSVRVPARVGAVTRTTGAAVGVLAVVTAFVVERHYLQVAWVIDLPVPVLWWWAGAVLGVLGLPLLLTALGRGVEQPAIARWRSLLLGRVLPLLVAHVAWLGVTLAVLRRFNSGFTGIPARGLAEIVPLVVLPPPEYSLLWSLALAPVVARLTWRLPSGVLIPALAALTLLTPAVTYLVFLLVGLRLGSMADRLGENVGWGTPLQQRGAVALVGAA